MMIQLSFKVLGVLKSRLLITLVPLLRPQLKGRMTRLWSKGRPILRLNLLTTTKRSMDMKRELPMNIRDISSADAWMIAWMIPKTLSLWVLMAQLPSLIYIHFPNRRQSFRFRLVTCFGVFGRPFGASGRQLLQSFLASVVLLTMHLRRCSLLGIGTISWARCFNHLRVGSFSYSPFLGFGSPCCSGKVLRTFFI
jgi:hypothetical protein